MKPRLLIIALMLFGLMLFFVDMGHGPGSALYQFYGFAHLAFFMAMALALSRWSLLTPYPFWLQAVGTIGAILILGGIIELIQPYFGRSASWRDLGIDGVGGLLGVVFLSPARRSLSRRILACVQTAALVIVGVVFYGPVTTIWDMWQALRQFPVLSDFETCFEAKRWSSGEIGNGIARHGEKSLRVALGTKKYAGTTLKRSFGDWRGWSSLAFSLYNPDPEPLRITVSIRDHEHFRRGGEYHDRFNRSFVLDEGWNDISIAVAEIENAPLTRRLKMDRLSEVVIFTANLPAPRVMFLDYIRLIR
jgi:hypothetical protein